MMTWAETAAKNEKITRQEADAWALRSHQRAIAAMDSGKFKEEIVPVSIPQSKGSPPSFDKDETPRRDTTLEKLGKLSPVYPDGICTAGNSSTENDGAAAVVLMSERKAVALRAIAPNPLPRVVSGLREGAVKTRTSPRETWKAGSIQGGEGLVEVVMGEGRKREVRRMLDAVCHPVLALVRTAIGPVRDPTLRPGSWRMLTVAEVRSLYMA